VLENIEQRTELNLIIQNLKESLIIFSQNKIELVNEQFLNQFKSIIIDKGNA
jgi:hypothetical protein